MLEQGLGGEGLQHRPGDDAVHRDIEAVAQLDGRATDDDAPSGYPLQSFWSAAQGPLGQWAWHYDVRTGAVVDRYPVYSVHQHGMGPMALRAVGEATGRRFDDALERSVAWVFGANELDESMIDPERGVIWRSIRRRLARGTLIHVFKVLTMARLMRASRGLASVVNSRGRLEIDRECRPYELGWLLVAGARR